MELQPASPTAPVPSDAPLLLVRLDLVAARLELIGQLDRRTAHLLHDAISALLQTDRPLWNVDVTGLTVADHTGLRAVETAYRRALVHDRALTLLGVSPGLHRALTRLDLDHPAPRGRGGRPSMPARPPTDPDTPSGGGRGCREHPIRSSATGWHGCEPAARTARPGPRRRNFTLRP